MLTFPEMPRASHSRSASQSPGSARRSSSSPKSSRCRSRSARQRSASPRERWARSPRGSSRKRSRSPPRFRSRSPRCGSSSRRSRSPLRSERGHGRGSSPLRRENRRERSPAIDAVAAYKARLNVTGQEAFARRAALSGRILPSNIHSKQSDPGRGSGGGSGDRACFNCGETGHLSRECPSQRRFSPSLPSISYTETPIVEFMRTHASSSCTGPCRKIKTLTCGPLTAY